jgi:hypothetical protein
MEMAVAVAGFSRYLSCGSVVPRRVRLVGFCGATVWRRRRVPPDSAATRCRARGGPGGGEWRRPRDFDPGTSSSFCLRVTVEYVLVFAGHRRTRCPSTGSLDGQVRSGGFPDCFLTSARTYLFLETVGGL